MNENSYTTETVSKWVNYADMHVVDAKKRDAITQTLRLDL